MKIELQLKESSQPIVLENVINSYQKGDMYCFYVGDIVYKFPLANIWRIKETYQ